MCHVKERAHICTGKHRSEARVTARKVIPSIHGVPSVLVTVILQLQVLVEGHCPSVEGQEMSEKCPDR